MPELFAKFGGHFHAAGVTMPSSRVDEFREKLNTYAAAHLTAADGSGCAHTGQVLWLKELESYVAFPPMQDPASYNLSQVLEQVKKQGHRNPSE